VGLFVSKIIEIDMIQLKKLENKRLSRAFKIGYIIIYNIDMSHEKGTQNQKVSIQ
jgi:hypothetical protein